MSGLDDGLFKPKHVAYFTWKCELCTTSCKRNISVHMLLLFVWMNSFTTMRAMNRVKISTDILSANWVWTGRLVRKLNANLYYSIRVCMLCLIYVLATWYGYLIVSYLCTSTTKLWGTRWRGWLRHCATSQKVASSIPDVVIGIFHWHNPSGHSITLGLTQPLT
jgi:hypothetical protein